jgi:hypothetical protein
MLGNRRCVEPPIGIYIVATTDEGTRCALSAARPIAERFHARVFVVVPRLTSGRSLFNPATNERDIAVQKRHRLAAALGLQVEVLFCICRHADDIILTMAGRSSLVFVGGRARPVWPSAEQRLARRLAARGVFALVGTSHFSTA